LEQLEVPEGFDPQEWKQWDEASQRRVLSMLDQATAEKRIWYCKRGRTCDGKAHEGAEYKHARGDQWPPVGSDWFVWLIMSGRGAGKTRSGAEWTRKISSKVGRIAGVTRRGVDFRATMVEGKSGLIKICEASGMKDYVYYPSRKEFHFPNGAVVYGYSAEEPDSLRGPEHGAAWLDEPAHMPLITDVWDNLLMGLRIPGLPGGAKVLCTSTPLPIKWLKDLIKDETTRMVRVSTMVNIDNLDPVFRRNVIDKYTGTRRGRQELEGEILEDVEGALWKMSMIEGYRDDQATKEEMSRILVSVDPAGTSSKRRDETGIVVVGKKGNSFYVLDDRSGHYTPEQWASMAWKLFDEYKADKIVAEKNYGGEMVLSTLRNIRAEDHNVKLVNSRRGKVLRAEPIVGLYEQHRVHHTNVFIDLEQQMTEWVPGESDSPDRVDALVHGITELSSGVGTSAISQPSGDGNKLTSESLMQSTANHGREFSGLVDVFGRPLRLS